MGHIEMKHSRWCKQFNQFLLAQSILVKILVEVSSIFDYFTTTRQYINMSIVPQNRDIKNIATTIILQAVIDQKDHSAKKTPCIQVMYKHHFLSVFTEHDFDVFSSKRSNLLKCNNQISALNKQLSATPLVIHYHCKPLWPFQIFPAIFVYILVLLWCMQPV